MSDTVSDTSERVQIARLALLAVGVAAAAAIVLIWSWMIYTADRDDRHSDSRDRQSCLDTGGVYDATKRGTVTCKPAAVPGAP